MSTHHVEMCFFLTLGLGELPSYHLATPVTVASMSIAYSAEPRRQRSPTNSHRSYTSAHGGVPARQAVHLHTWSKPSCSHSAAYLSHPLKNIRKTTHSNPFFPKREVATIPLITLPTYAGITLTRPISITPYRPRPRRIGDLSPHYYLRRRST